MKSRFFRISAIFLILTVILCCTTSMLANAQSESDVPNETYSRWTGTVTDKNVYSKPMYEVETVISARTYGMSDAFTGITDIHCVKNGDIYLLLGGQSKLIVFDKDYNIKKTITEVVVDGQATQFEGAKGVFSNGDGKIYICDTKNSRVLVINSDGEYIKSIILPESSLIPASFTFNPMKLVCDSRGYTFVLSEGSYYGAILYSPDDVFLGFYGANTVKSTPLQALEKIWDLMTSTNEKKSTKVKALPFQFVDLYADTDDYIYTVTGATSVGGTSSGQIKRLSPGGVNILYKNINGKANSASDYNFGESETTARLGIGRVQNFCNIAVTDDGYICALDETYGKIYIYDNECNMLSAFGGGSKVGKQVGSYQDAISLAVCGNKIFVADAVNNNIVVYNRTDYGAIVQQAQSLKNKGDYREAKDLWEQALSMDRNSQLAYSGLAKAYLIEGNYKTAMKYAEYGADRNTYSQAFAYVRKAYINDNFTLIFICGIVIVVGLIALLVYTNKRKVRLIKNKKVRTMFLSIMHPFQAFGDIKYKKQGSFVLSLILIALFYIFSVLKVTKGGFLFTEFDSSSFNALYTLAQTVGVVILWSVTNWAMCTLFNGKGRFKEVLTVTAYSTIPMIAESIIFLILSHVLVLSGGTLLSFIHITALIMTGIMLCVGTMVVHDFNFPKVCGTSIVTLLAMLLVVFILFMIGILLQQFCNFAVTLFMEVIYR